MRIANPMYDAVFKHLLEDPASAKLIVGSILGEDLESLEMVPQESAVQVGSSRSAAAPEGAGFTVLRVDFAATVRTVAGEHLRVLIEVQKARYSDDVMRFRRYLGTHYADERNAVTYLEDGRKRSRPRRLTTIYFLGEPLPCADATVLKVTRQYVDAVTGERLAVREEFVEALTHDCYVVQVSRLPTRRRNDLEKLLSVFDQDLRAADSRHALEVDAAAMPDRYAPVLRRLQRAAASPELRHSMLTEDEILGAWERMHRENLEQQKALAEQRKAFAEQQKALEDRQKALAEQRKAFAEQQKTLEEQQKTLAERQKTLAEQQKTLAERDETIAAQRAENEKQRGEIEELRRRLGDRR